MINAAVRPCSGSLWVCGGVWRREEDHPEAGTQSMWCSPEEEPEPGKPARLQRSPCSSSPPEWLWTLEPPGTETQRSGYLVMCFWFILLYLKIARQCIKCLKQHTHRATAHIIFMMKVWRNYLFPSHFDIFYWYFIDFVLNQLCPRKLNVFMLPLKHLISLIVKITRAYNYWKL